jgi:hypothetical protein
MSVVGVNRGSRFRGVADFYPTPAGASWALARLGVLPTRVWEPACGDGAMARVLEAAGHEVVATDLHDRGFGEAPVDFLQERRLRAPAIVTNPPFSLADDFVAHSLDLGAETVAMFLRLKYLEGAARQQHIYRRGGLATVYVFVERVKFFSGETDRESQPGWNTEAFAWFLWRRGHDAPAEIRWVSRDSGPALAHLLD